MSSKTAVALAVAVAIAGIASPAFAQANHQRTRGSYDYTRGTQAYDYAPQTPQGAAPSNPKWVPQMAGGGSMGYNSHNEVSN
jgi:hypothetical protein